MIHLVHFWLKEEYQGSRWIPSWSCARKVSRWKQALLGEGARDGFGNYILCTQERL